MKTIIYKKAAIFIASSLKMEGCSDDDKTPRTPAVANANVKVVHASPDSKTADLLLDDNFAGADLTYPNNPGYLEVAEGTKNIYTVFAKGFVGGTGA